MDIGALIGLITAFSGLILGFLIEAKFEFTALSGLISAPAASFVLIGTIGAVILSFPVSELKKLPGALKTVFTIKHYNEVDMINQLAELSEKARKDGLLSLEQDAQSNENELIKKGLALVVDGIETEVIKDILERENELRESIHESGGKIFEAAGGYSPTMGVLGTVMGMVNILGHMGADTVALAHMIATAFVATMYGVLFANAVYLPFASRIKVKAEREKMINDLIIEGLLSIQAGENPRIIKEKLNLTLLEKMSGKSDSKQEQLEEVEG
ncbi:chemotaxis protein MotA [Anaerobacterium chartisolvens]|uniref:Chemotaxis protein MotA n=1 Tax=Anaerobacterium chartisolvens TaxID=1297424 RepID=A0A369B3N7_9FIRM|nr:MotA/TolQ/ExbB proton channel family protein [Anaerobacterium chartisolvens]RCX14324.1 chemotaxis protein MotA [Anaerobacterium chartisolvens]